MNTTADDGQPGAGGARRASAPPSRGSRPDLPGGRGASGTGGSRPAAARGAAGRGGSTRDGTASGRPATPDRRSQIEQRAYDPRREERRKASRVPLPDDVEARMLDPEVRTELRPLNRDTADLVARHLVMAGRLIDEEPEQALLHARAARALAGRIGPVREAAGLAAYAAGEWADALAELRAARRISGSAVHLAVMADCERALGRPERALAYGEDAAVPGLEAAVRVELIIVLAGARRDLGQAEAAVLQLQDPARRTKRSREWAPRLFYAHADALLDAGRLDEARRWFSAAADADEQGATDADERVLELDGVVLSDLQDEEQDADGGAAEGAGEPAADDDPATSAEAGPDGR